MVVCRAQQQSVFAKAAAAGVSVPALLAAHPAFALVDDRLAGEGTGKIFGINDSALFWNMLVSAQRRRPRSGTSTPHAGGGGGGVGSRAASACLVQSGSDTPHPDARASPPFLVPQAIFGSVWALYYVSQRDLGGDDGDLTL